MRAASRSAGRRRSRSREEALGYVAQGYRAVKLRVGDNPRDDVARATAVREAVGDDHRNPGRRQHRLHASTMCAA